ncbi:MAG: hypothetical protein C0503_03295 [Gemmatimonas sp.]|nr:hypothetical protein [Gemmatimonas sp.]
MRAHLVVSTLLLSLSATALAAQRSPDSVRVRSTRTRKLSSRVDGGVDYDDNVFLLPDAKKGDLQAPSASELISQRYALMESPTDVIATLRAAVSLQGDGLGGRDLSITPAVGYESYAQNAERRNVSLSLALAQDLRRDGRIRLRAGFLPTYYARNYLSDAVDVNANGSITSAERRYARGDYSELGVELDYRYRLLRARRSRPLGAFLDIGVGYASRRHDAPFTARDFTGPTAALRLELSPRRGLDFETSYEAAFLDSPIRSQVILLDEPAFGEDLNGNGNATDLNARTVQTVDRSRAEHVIGQAMRVDLGRTDVELSVRYRLRNFTSSQPYDVANNGRRDRRLQLGAELSRRLVKDLRLVTGVRYGSQRLNRRTDLGAEGAVDDYTQLQAQIGLRYTP